MTASPYAFGASMSNARTGQPLHSTAIVHKGPALPDFVSKMGETCLGTASA